MILGPKDCSSLALFQVPKPMFLLSGLPPSLLSLFRLAILPSFFLSLDSTIPPHLSDSFAPSFLSWPLSGILQLFFCLSTATATATVAAVTTRAARLPLQSSCASASSLCVNGSGHSSNDAEQKRQEKGPFGKSFIGPNVAASGVSEEGVFWLTLKLNQTAYFMDKKEV